MKNKVLKADQKPAIQLSKGIYSEEIDPSKTPFGFINDQRRNNGVLNNAGWFNGAGEKLGSGDLSLNDLIRVGKTLSTGEVFLALSEFDTLWDMPSHLDNQAPGIDYVMKNAVWAVYTGNVYRIKKAISKQTKTVAGYTEIQRTEFHKAVGYGVKRAEAPQPPELKLPHDDDELNALIQQAKTMLQKQGKFPVSAPSKINTVSGGNVPTGNVATAPVKKSTVIKKLATATKPSATLPGTTPVATPTPNP